MMRVTCECRECGIGFDAVVDTGIGDTEQSVLRHIEKEGEDICSDCGQHASHERLQRLTPTTDPGAVAHPEPAR